MSIPAVIVWLTSTFVYQITEVFAQLIKPWISEEEYDTPIDLEMYRYYSDIFWNIIIKVYIVWPLTILLLPFTLVGYIWSFVDSIIGDITAFIF